MEYFTPTIEELHVGYQCEIKIGQLVAGENSDRHVWWEYEVSADDLYRVQCIYKKECVEEFRTPFLTKEQIEVEGFVWNGNHLDVHFENHISEGNWYENFPHAQARDFYNYPIWGIRIKYAAREYKHNDNCRMKIEFDFSSSWETVFEGEIKSINEFRKLMKWLKIK